MRREERDETRRDERKARGSCTEHRDIPRAAGRSGEHGSRQQRTRDKEEAFIHRPQDTIDTYPFSRPSAPSQKACRRHANETRAHGIVAQIAQKKNRTGRPVCTVWPCGAGDA